MVVGYVVDCCVRGEGVFVWCVEGGEVRISLLILESQH